MVFHKKKQKNIDEGNDYADKHGDYLIYIAKKADTKLHLAHSTGKSHKADYINSFIQHYTPP